MKIYCPKVRELIADTEDPEEVLFSLQDRVIRFKLMRFGVVLFEEKVILPEFVDPATKSTALFMYKRRWAEEVVQEHFEVEEGYY